MARASLPETFESFLARQRRIIPGDRIFVACSGGPDSVALFQLFRTLSPEWKLKLGLLHLNHGLRGRQSDRDERFVRKLAVRAGVPCYTGRVSVGKMLRKENLSLEEAARLARYHFFQTIARRYGIRKIALAHTKDDQAETVLMRVLQGTGLRGLCGIRPELRMGKIRLIRPLLDISKAEILDFLKNQRITFCKDSSNDSRRFLRNRLRSEIIPKLKQSVNPRLVDALARLPSVVWEENRMLDFLETTAWRKSVISIRPGRLLIRRNMLMKFPAPLQFRLLDRALKRIDPRSGLAFDAWERLRTQLVLKRYRLSLPKDIDLELTASAISLYRKGFRPKN